jgi:alpha-ketoglutarate-dependent taurine dioxygenase
VTGLKALNVNGGFVTGFAELKKEESDNLINFFRYHIHSADDHYVRWKWAVGSVAMWDNVSLFMAIPSYLELLTLQSEMCSPSCHL